jgi:hypothetical protein
MNNPQFWDWYEAVAAPRLELRHESFRKMFQYLDGLDRPVVIVETGCARQAGNWAGDGQSTVLFDTYAGTRPGSVVHTVDINPEATAACAALVGPGVSIHTGDSVAVLRAIAQDLADRALTVDLLYLDSFDLDVNNPVPAAVHHLKELLSIAGAITRDTLVVVDDSPSIARIALVDGTHRLLGPMTIDGKGKYVAEYAQQVGAIPLFSCFQVGWTGLSTRGPGR